MFIRFSFRRSRSTLFMKIVSLSAAYFLTLACFTRVQPANGAGVTLITHGLEGNVDGWITGMADQLPKYSRFPGSNSTCYKINFYANGGYYYLTSSRVAGNNPLGTDSGEIIVKFDWSLLADGNSYNTA